MNAVNTEIIVCCHIGKIEEAGVVYMSLTISVAIHDRYHTGHYLTI